MKETNKRLEILYRNHHKWLYSVAFKVSKSDTISEDLIQELYLYLSERNDENLYYQDSFNLQYCRSFIISRFYNLIKIDNRTTELFDTYDKEDIEYDYEYDNKIENSYNELVNELSQMKKEKGWSSAKLFELYWFSDMTFETLSNEIGISKSTAFLNVRKVKQKLKDKLKNPFEDDTERN
jgi:RNA polymerase sigma-70 factor (ECF subfamily)